MVGELLADYRVRGCAEWFYAMDSSIALIANLALRPVPSLPVKHKNTRPYKMSPEAIEARRLGGLARQESLGEDGRSEYSRDRAMKRWSGVQRSDDKQPRKKRTTKPPAPKTAI